uniref:Ig-like domain-containing protein n=1 Tax=Micrurus lemniscatus lemniscatus TaxID=129467 RepID=A0A2D4HTB3_MICLE
MKQEDMLICTASGGYPEEKLYWVSKTGTNLIHKATFQSVKNENGSFSLNNTLQLLSIPSETEYCCIFNHTRVPSRQPASACMTFENVTTSKSKTEETTLNMSGTIVIVIAVISLASILLAVMWWRKRRRNYLLQEEACFIHFKLRQDPSLGRLLDRFKRGSPS